MVDKKKKLHLRKQFKILLPSSVLFSIFIIVFIFCINGSTKLSISSINHNTNNKVLEKNPTIERTLNKYNDKLRKLKIENTIIFYADLFKLDRDMVLDKAKELTSNFENEKYQNTFNITFDLENNNTFPNIEAGIIYYVKIIYSYPERFGYTWETIHLDETPEVERKYNDKNQIIMKNGYTFEEYVGKIADIFKVDKSLALAIIYNESGRCRSNLFKINNNVAGMRSYYGWAKYPTLEAGTISFIINLRSLLLKYGIDTTTEEGLLNLSSVYVNGHLGEPAYNWYDNVSKIRVEVTNKNLFK